MGLVSWWKNRNRPSPAERRIRLLKQGRITEGRITETEMTDSGETLLYFTYSIQGVDFEAAEVMTEEQGRRSGDYAPGATVNIRYDTRNYGDAVIE